ncbi:MAG: dTDP-4-dehydrorhamnose 3,5-epimerase family protein, partial [Tabrizicola sp.]
KRNLQLEAVAHIEVQRWIDTGGLTDHPLAPESLREIHRRFCRNLPPELLVVPRLDGTELPIVPGEFRTDFVQVGKHVAPSPGAVPRFLAHMRKMYGRWHGVELSASRMNAIYIPEGFAHGFMTLEPETTLLYHITPAHVPGHSVGIRWDDPALSITWPDIPQVISQTDSALPNIRL